MAMNSGTLTTALKATIKAEVQSLYSIEDTAKLDDFAQALAAAIAQEVVSHIQSNASVSGVVTSGAGAGGTVTGTVS